MLDLKIADSWKKLTGSTQHSLSRRRCACRLGREEQEARSRSSIAAYKEAAEWIAAHPDDAAKLILPKGTDEDRKAIAELIRANDRLGMNIQCGGRSRKEIKSVYAAGKSIAFLPSDPSPRRSMTGR